MFLNTISLFCWMGRGNHPETFLLVALFWQSTALWLKVRWCVAPRIILYCHLWGPNFPSLTPIPCPSCLTINCLNKSKLFTGETDRCTKKQRFAFLKLVTVDGAKKLISIIWSAWVLEEGPGSHPRKPIQGFLDLLMGLLIQSIYLGMLQTHNSLTAVLNINCCPQPVLGLPPHPSNYPNTFIDNAETLL